MADNTLALQVQPTQFGNNFAAGFNNGMAQQAEKQKQEASALAQMAQIGLGVMDGKLDGPIDPQRLEQAIGLLGNSPIAAKVKENPELLRTITKGSMDVLRYVQDSEKFELAKQQFEAELAQSQQPKPTDDMREYEFAKSQGYEGSFTDYQTNMRKSGATQVNVGPNGEEFGDPGKGLVWQRTPDGKVALDDRGAPIAIPFQGGEAWQKQQAAQQAGAVKESQADTKAGIVTEDVDRALEKIKADPFWTTGLMAGWASQIGGTPAADVKRLIDTVKANAGFNELQKMRDASPTGGALGQVTERELQFLQSVIGSLEQDQSSEQLIYNLERVKEAFLDIVHGPRNWGDEGNTPAGGVVDWTDYFN